MNLPASLQKNKILVVGDIMLDTYFMGNVKRISPEAPVPIFAKERERYALGGAANVAANLIVAGEDVFMMTTVGNDKAGNQLKIVLKTININTELVFTINKVTTEKIRFLSKNNQQAFRYDVEDTSAISDKDCDKMLNIFEGYFEKFSLLLFLII